MKHQLYSIVLLLFFLKGLESNHLSSKIWPFKSYDKIDYSKLTIKDKSDPKTKLFYTIVDALQAESLFSEYSYNRNENEVKFKCEDDLLVKTHKIVLDRTEIFEKTVIEACFTHMSNCSVTDIDCYLGVFKSKLSNTSMMKMLPTQHKLKINDFNADKNSVNVQHHVKFALLYSSSEYYSLLTKERIINSDNLEDSEIKPTLYILYDAVREKNGEKEKSYDNVEGKCDICQKKITNEYTLSSFAKVKDYYSSGASGEVFKYPQIYGHLRCFYDKYAKKTEGHLEEYFMNEIDFKIEEYYFFIDPNNDYRSHLYVFELFNRFFNFRRINSNVSLVKDYKKLHEINEVFERTGFSTYMNSLNREYNEITDSSGIKYFEKELNRNFGFYSREKLERFKPLMMSNIPYPEILEPGRRIIQKLDNFILKAQEKVMTKDEAKEILDLGSEILVVFKLINEQIKRVITSNVTEVIKKYDFQLSSIEFLLSLE